MKHLFLSLCAMMLCLSASAQKITYGSMPNLSGIKKMQSTVDYSEMTINNMSLADWLEYRNAEQPEYNAKDEFEKELVPVLKSDLIPAALEKTMKKGLLLSPTKGEKYKMVVKILNMAKKGDLTAEVYIMDAATGTKLVSFDLKGNGGTFGSMSNLWGDGCRSAGSRLGKFLSKYID